MKTDQLTDNEVICQFMGFEIVSENPVIKGIVCHGRTWKAPVENVLPYWGGFRAEQLHKFESSWSWLMPVWYKFRDLKMGNNEDHEVEHSDRMLRIADTVAYGSIEEACKLLAKGIRWYNGIKK